jgi:hypothetical protein
MQVTAKESDATRTPATDALVADTTEEAVHVVATRRKRRAHDEPEQERQPRVD